MSDYFKQRMAEINADRTAYFAEREATIAALPLRIDGER